jgi:ubiquinol-cytochrome c reductase core subunit 2
MLASTRASVRLARRSFATAVDVGGLKVAAIDSNQPTVAVTFLAKAGPRYQQKPGVAHALKNFAFKVRISLFFSSKVANILPEHGGPFCTRDSARE